MSRYDELNRLFQKHYDRILSFEGLFLLLAGIAVGIFALDVLDRQIYLLWSLLFALGIVPFLANRFKAFPLELRREISKKVVAGNPVSYCIVVRNLSSQTLRGLHIRDEALDGSIRLQLRGRLGEAVGELLPGEERRVKLQLEFRRRGVFELHSIRGEYLDFFGLTRYGKSFELHSSVIVHPKFYSLSSLDLRKAEVHQAGGIPLAASVGDSLEFRSLRNYRRGDPMAHISWKAFARIGKPVVREFQGEYFPRLAIVLDTALRDDPEGMEGMEDFEGAVSTVASLASYFQDKEYIIDLFAAGPHLHYLCSGRSLARMDEVLDLLACVSPRRDDGFPELDEKLRGLLSRISALIIVTSDWRSTGIRFYRSIMHDVAEIKVICLKRKELSADTSVIADPERMLKKIDSRRLQEEVLTL